MMWYNNPEAVQVVLNQRIDERTSRTQGLRLVKGHETA